MRSCLKRHGGKHYLAKHIIVLMPFHNRYCEAFFGSGAVMLQKQCDGIAEWANDKDGQLTNFWSVLRDDDISNEFLRILNCTEFSKEQFEQAKSRLYGWDVSYNDWEVSAFAAMNRAIDFFIVNRQSRQALGKDFATPTTRLRAGMNENVSAWLSAVDGLPELHARLRRVEIWNEDAITFIDKLDKSNDTLFYCDPPYLPETRSAAANEYGEYEMSYEQHVALLDYLLCGMIGKVILSGYPSELYNEKLKGWRHCDIEIDNKSSSSTIKEMKTERIWMNYK